MLTVRKATPEDTIDFLELQRKLAREGEFLLLTIDEVDSVSERKLSENLSNYFINPSIGNILLAFYNSELVGYIGYKFPQLSKVRHQVVDIAIAVLEIHQRIGVGSKLLKVAETNWKEQKKLIARIKVISTNFKAIKFYEKQGFKKEGNENMSIKSPEGYIDQLCYFKLLT